MYADHRISPFEGSPRAGAAEYVQGGMFYLNEVRELPQRSMCTLGMLIIRYAKVIKKYQLAKKNRLPFLGAVSIVKKYRRIDNLKLLR